MKTRQLNRLSAKTAACQKTPGLYCDGGGLYLQVAPTGSKSWIFRFRSRITGKLRDMGLGSIHSVGLADARIIAAAKRSLVASGLDPLVVRDAEIVSKTLQASKSVTFLDCANSYIESHRRSWRNEKHASQWVNSINTYCQPVMGSLPAQDIDTALVLQVLEPIWAVKSETASRLRGRIENILDWAKARGYRSGENPARWKGHLNQLLPTMAKKDRVIHHKAMPFTEISEFVSCLRKLDSVSARCLEFTILTAARTSEATRATPGEFDVENATWTIPASRMKAKKEHRVPLSPRALEIVREMLTKNDDFLFCNSNGSEPMCNMAMLQLLKRMHIAVTVHGFRSAFRDWAAECTSYSHEVCEMALAHTITNAAEAAYRRGNLFEKRRHLMHAWAEYCSCTDSARVVQMRPRTQLDFATAI